MNLRRSAQWPVIVALLLAVACNHKNSSNQRLDVAVKNQASTALDKVNVRFGQHNCYVGILSPDATAVHMYFEASIGDSAEVTWVEPNGEKKQRTVSLIGIYDAQKPGRLNFEIEVTNVIVKFQDLN
jgi:hypothetical protein